MTKRKPLSLDWLEALPEIGGRFVERGRDIAAQKSELLAQLADVYRSEANLWTDVAASGEWSKADVGKALSGIDGHCLPYLPNRFPKPVRPS